ncbi:MAG: hypothetical protein HQ534_13300 [Armatimonadetes bacterium]|nr:hypothetical protein [Armatimonadota bacterium]
MIPFEYFLGLKEIKGYEEKVNEIKRNAIKTPNSNDGIKQWASICAEIGAIYIIEKHLGYDILGFEQKSPKRRNKKQTCDFKAKKNTSIHYFEVKRKSSQIAQKLPTNLQNFLIDFKCNFKLVGELNNRKYRCNNFKELENNLVRHIDSWKCGYLNAFPYDEPPPYLDENLTIFFYKEGLSGSGFFRPDGVNSICNFLFDTNRVGKNDNRMIPMVSQAELKGADYLCCNIPDWDDYSFDLLVKSFFEKYTKKTLIKYETTDNKMKKLKGIILFNRYDKFCIINQSGFDSG